MREAAREAMVVNDIDTGQREASLAIIAAAQSMDAAGFTPNKSGNVSQRFADGYLITPAAQPYATLQADDIVHLNAAGHVKRSRHRPSSEWSMHAMIYRQRPDAHAILHNHSPNATALSATRRGIPPFHYMIAVARGDIRCANYATFGTDALAENAVAALADRNAALLANHGVVAIGATLSAALSVAIEVENLARQYLLLLAAGLTPTLLDDAEMAVVLKKFRDYGR